jgi:hypothetical protein
MKKTYCLAATAAVVLLGAVHGQAQSVTFNFQDNTDDGFGLKFSNDASASFSIVNIGGSLRMQVPRTGAFQEADRASQGSDSFLAAMQAAMLNPSGYKLSYDWYVDPTLSPGNNGTFLQLGSYINSGSGSYAQNFPATGKEVELNGTQLSGTQVIQGTVSETFAAAYGDTSTFTGQSFLRLGFIENGNGTGVSVFYDNITISPVPEPSSFALLGLAAPLFWAARRVFPRRQA